MAAFGIEGNHVHVDFFFGHVEGAHIDKSTMYGLFDAHPVAHVHDGGASQATADGDFAQSGTGRATKAIITIIPGANDGRIAETAWVLPGPTTGAHR